MGWIGTVRESDGGRGKFKERLTGGEPERDQISMHHAGFRARKNAMHELDHKGDENIEDRFEGEENAFHDNAKGIEKEEKDQGVKEVSGKAGREYKD